MGLIFKSEKGTEKKELSAKLEFKGKLFYLIKEDSSGGLYFEEVSKQYAAFFKKKPASFYGKPLKNIISNNEYKKLKKDLYNSKKNGIHHSETRLENRNNICYLSNFYVHISVNKLQSYYLCSIKDITKQKLILSFDENEINYTNKYLELAGVMILVLDNKGKVRVINKKGCEILGYDKSEIIGKDWFKNFIPSENSKNLTQSFEKLMKGKIPENYFENNILNKKGEVLLIYWHSSQIKDKDGNIIGLISYGEDISEKRKLQNELVVQTRNSDFLYILSRSISDTPDLSDLLSKASHLISDNPGMLGGILCIGDEVNLSECNYIEPFGKFDKILKNKKTELNEILKNIINSGNLHLIEELYYDYYGSKQKVFASLYKMKTKNETQGYFIAVTDYMDLILNNFLMLIAGELGQAIKRKSAEVEKKLSEEKFLSIFNTSPDAIAITELDGDKVLEINKSFEELTGYSRNELLSGKINFKDTWADPGQRNVLIDRVLKENKIVGFEALRRKKNGELFNALMSSSVLSYNNINSILTVIVDVSEIVKINNEIKETKQLMEKITYTTPSFICLYDVIKDKVLYNNRSLLESLGYTKSDLDVFTKFGNSHKMSFYHKDDLATISGFDKKMRELKEGEIAKIEYRVKDAKSNWHWFQQTATLFHKSTDDKKILTINVFENISDRKQAEDAIKKHGYEAELLYQAGKAISGTLDLNEIYDRMYQIISKVADCKEMIVTSYDHEKQLIHYKYLRARATHDRVNVSNIPPIPLAPRGFGIVSEVIRTGKSLLINDYEEYFHKVKTKYVISEEGKINLSEQKGSEAPGSALVIPIILDDKILGVVQILSAKLKAFNMDQLKFVESLMQQVALANRNAIVFEQAQNEIRERKIAQENLKKSESNLRKFAESVPDVLYRLNYETGKYDFLSRNVERVLGYNISEILSNPKGFSAKTIHPDDIKFVTDSIEKHIKYGKVNRPLNIECRMVRKDRNVIWVNDSIIFEYKNGNIIAAIGAMSDITEKKIEEENRRKRDESIIRHQSALLELSKITGEDFYENLNVITKITSEALKVSRVCIWMFNSEKTELIRKTCYDHNLQSCEEEIYLEVGNYRELIDTLKNDEKVSIGYSERDKNIKGFLEYFSIQGKHSASLITRIHSRGDIAGFLCIMSKDTLMTEWPPDIYDFAVSVAGFITLVIESNERLQAENEIKKSLKDKEILLREIHHRVKNNLQVVSSMLFLQSKKLYDTKLIDTLIESQNRVKSMVMIHEKLYRSEDLASINYADYIKELANSLFRSYSLNASKVRLELDVGNILLDTDTAVHCGLIINELVSNSIKHAFPGDREGIISINFYNSNNNEYSLIVSDNGVGMNENFNIDKSDTLGMQLINTFVEQLHGNLKITNSNGTTFVINFTVKDRN